MNTTRDYYNRNAQEYFLQTVNVQLSDSWDDFLSRLKPNSSILDVGCGSGRDLKYFKSRGFRPVGVDYSEKICKIAREYSCTEVICGDVKSIILPKGEFNGVWAMASLLHINKKDVHSVLIKLNNALRDNGILFTGMKQGNVEEIDINGRFFAKYEEKEWNDILHECGFRVEGVSLNLDSMQRKDKDLPVLWIETIAIKEQEIK